MGRRARVSDPLKIVDVTLRGQACRGLYNSRLTFPVNLKPAGYL